MAFFTDINDAINRLGGELQSPTWTSVNQLHSHANAMNFGANVDTYAMQIAFPDQYDGFAETIGAVDQFSRDLTNCGNYVGNALHAATTDYIKNTGIQQAGRELADKLKLDVGSEVDCIAGFATLIKSQAMMDAAMGLADLSQMGARIGQVIKDATDPTRLANVVMNMSIIHDLLQSAQGICDAIHDGLEKLIKDDLNSLLSILNKLSKWAAFAKIATSDPCSLVTNQKMLSHITEPVMADIISLYDEVTNPAQTLEEIAYDQGFAYEEGYLSVAKFANPNFIQDTAVGQLSFEDYSESLSIEELEAYDEGYASTAGFADQVAQGKNPLPVSAQTFYDNKEMVEFTNDHALNPSNFTITDCSGGTFSSKINRDVKSGCLDSGGVWSEESVSKEEYDDIISADAPPTEKKDFSQGGSGKDKIANKANAERTKVDKQREYLSTSKGTISPSAGGSPSSVSTSLFDGSGKTDKFSSSSVPSNQYFKQPDGAKFQVTNKVVGGFDNAVDKIRGAVSSGDFSKIITCKCYLKSSTLTITDKPQCMSLGGNWNCQSGSKTLMKKKNIVSEGMSTSKKVIDAGSSLPTSVAFDASLI